MQSDVHAHKGLRCAKRRNLELKFGVDNISFTYRSPFEWRQNFIDEITEKHHILRRGNVPGDQ